jgi:hypothetical protein
MGQFRQQKISNITHSNDSIKSVIMYEMHAKLSNREFESPLPISCAAVLLHAVPTSDRQHS